MNYIENVSIPIGFSIELRQRELERGEEDPISFNPYRVFH